MKNQTYGAFGSGTRVLHLDRDVDPGMDVAPPIQQSVTHFAESGAHKVNSQLRYFATFHS